MLLAQLQFGEWVLRRVGTIAFQDERSVVREMTVDLRVRDDAPVFVDDAGVEYWLAPLTLMRRRTLVDFHIRTEDDQPVRMPGLRLAQQLDEAILMAAAATTTRHQHAVDGGDAAVVTRFIQTLVAGRRDEVRECWHRFEATSLSGDGPLEVLRGSRVFTTAARTLRNGFTLYAFLRAEAGGTGCCACPSSSRSAGSTSGRTSTPRRGRTRRGRTGPTSAFRLATAGTGSPRRSAGRPPASASRSPRPNVPPATTWRSPHHRVSASAEPPCSPADPTSRGTG